MINYYADDAMRILLEELNIKCVAYDSLNDPTRQKLSACEMWQECFTKKEWTIGPRAVGTARKRLANKDDSDAQPKQKKPANSRKTKAETTDESKERNETDLKPPIKTEGDHHEANGDAKIHDLKQERSEETC